MPDPLHSATPGLPAWMNGLIDKSAREIRKSAGKENTKVRKERRGKRDE
jgi:hypothetical protein